MYLQGDGCCPAYCYDTHVESGRKSLKRVSETDIAYIWQLSCSWEAIPDAISGPACIYAQRKYSKICTNGI